MAELFAMNVYGAYVWGAYGFTALVLVAITAQSLRAMRKKERELAGGDADDA